MYIKGNQKEAGWKSTKSKFLSLVIYSISFFLFSCVTNDFQFFFVFVFFVDREPVRGIFLLSTTLLESGEVLIETRAKRGLI